MSVLNLFRSKSSQPASYVDLLEEAHAAVGSALNVFTVAQRGLQEAVAKYEDVAADAAQTIEYYQARADEAREASTSSQTILSKIEALLS